MGVWYKGKRIDGPQGPAGLDGNPIGTIISYMGLTAPQDYLACDGSVYNIADYSELAKFFETQFGTTNHFGGDGTTTFAVPDFRNLFLRGYHGSATEQLSGEIGVKQEATDLPPYGVADYGLVGFATNDLTSSVAWPSNFDKTIGTSSIGRYVDSSVTKTWSTTLTGFPKTYTTRPVNAAVLYCIKAVVSNTTVGSLILQSVYITTPPDKISYSPGDMFDPSGMVITARYNGGFFKQIAEYTVTPDGPLTIGTDTITISYTENGITATVNQSIHVLHIYGVTWNDASITKWTRTDGAAMFTDPVPYVAGATNYSSPFDNIMPWSGMVKEERAGGTMVKIPKFWYQLYQNTEGDPSSGMTIRISDEPLEGFSVSPAHMDRGDGKGERDAVYIGRYHCAASDYKSRTGEKPKDNLVRSTARTKIHNLGTNIWQTDFAMRFTIWLLYLVEFADWGSQEKIGYGCGNGTSAENMGYTDTMPYHTGTTKSSRDTYGLGTQYRNIEGLWDNIYDWCDGCYYNNEGLNIILNPNKFNDNSNGVSVGTPTNGFPSSFNVVDLAGFRMFIPFASEGSNTTGSCDFWEVVIVDGRNTVFSGGVFSFPDRGLGMFYLGNSNDTYFDGNLGSRIQELP